MGSCSFREKDLNTQAIKVIPIQNTTPTIENEKRPEEIFLNARKSKSKQKAALLEVRKGSISVTDAPTAQIQELPKTERDLILIEKCFQRHFIFTLLTQDQKAVIISSMKHFTLRSNQIIFRQGNPGNNFFIVISGVLEVIVNENRINTITEGNGFGELALMHDTPRTATINTLTNVTLWGLDRDTFRNIIQDLNASNYLENKNFIESVSVFNILTQSQIEVLVGSVTTLNYGTGQVIVKEGDVGNLLFIIKEGVVSCTRKNVEIKKFVKGEYFGEQALLYNTTRTATCTALTEVRCLSIDRESLASALGSKLEEIIFRNSQSIAIEKNEILNKLSQSQAEAVIKAMQIRKCPKGEILALQKTPKNKEIFFVLKGKVKHGNYEIDKLQCIGVEECVYDSDQVYETDLVCEEDTEIAGISKEKFLESIGGDFLEVTYNNDMLKILKKVQIFRELGLEKLNALISAMKFVRFEDSQVIVQQNSPGDSFYIVKSGKVIVNIDGHEVRTITKHDYFGERSLIFNQVRTATVVALGPVECWVLFQVDFLRIIDAGLRSQLIKRIELQDDNLTLDDLILVKVLGKGMFGVVFLAAHRTRKILYAIKTVDRKKIHAYELYDSLVLERKVLLQIDHIFIMKLIKTLKDPKRIYFVLEYVRGMDLFDVLRKMGLVSENDSRFFTACLIIILQHLHEREIIYRDLKPENVVVDEEGYLKLIDFGTAKIVNTRTYTIVGTPHYMAPEIILRKGYGVSADYWSLGIVLYELIYERVPFADDYDDPMKIYEVILTSTLKFPKMTEPLIEAKSVISHLLDKNPSIRVSGGFEKLKMHPWFASLDWEKLLSKSIKPPYIPKVKTHEIEEDLEEMSKKNFDAIISAEETTNLPFPAGKPPLKWDQDF